MNIAERKARLKARRTLRNQRRLASEVSVQADKHVEHLFIRRLGRLHAVRRFVLVWTVLVGLMGFGALWQVTILDAYYLKSQAVAGGTYREGILGVYTNGNPLFATSSVDASVARLVFSGLMKVSPRGSVEGDLVSSYTVNEKETEYVLQLKPDVKWHDGEMLTADDVVFTYRAIQHPDVRSPLRSSWRGVKVEKVDDLTVKFTLPSPLSSFLHGLTTGIVPEHVLSQFEFEELRSTDFNVHELVGTGPFTLKNLEVLGDSFENRQERIVLSRFPDFHGGGVSLNGVILRSYRSEELMIEDFNNQAIQAMVGISTVPSEVSEQEGVRVIASPLTSSVMAFFKTTSPVMEERGVRQALVHATNVDEVRNALDFFSVKSDSPFLKSQFVYDPEVTQLPYDPDKANQILDKAGWERDEIDGLRSKEEQKLSLSFVSQGSSEYAEVAQLIKKQWEEIGVTVDLNLLSEEDIQTTALSSHQYDVLLYGISIGYDPDVFAYWHSSQADPNAVPRLNLSEYSNSVVDEALESGRTRSDQELRKIKLDPFLEQWRKDAPAVALYQPRLLMVVQEPFADFVEGEFSSSADRLWSITQLKIKNTQVVR